MGNWEKSFISIIKTSVLSTFFSTKSKPQQLLGGKLTLSQLKPGREGAGVWVTSSRASSWERAVNFRRACRHSCAHCRSQNTWCEYVCHLAASTLGSESPLLLRWGTKGVSKLLDLEIAGGIKQKYSGLNLPFLQLACVSDLGEVFSGDC